jgi:hypothetical protein
MALERARPWVRTFELPHYTSETLNWIERFWEQVKDTYFSRMLIKLRQAFYDDAIRLLRRLRKPGAVRRLMLRTTPEKT